MISSNGKAGVDITFTVWRNTTMLVRALTWITDMGLPGMFLSIWDVPPVVASAHETSSWKYNGAGDDGSGTAEGGGRKFIVIGTVNECSWRRRGVRRLVFRLRSLHKIILTLLVLLHPR